METTPTHLDLTLGMSSILQSLLVFSVIGMVYLQSWVRIFCCCLHHALVIGQANTSSMYNKYIIAYMHIYIYIMIWSYLWCSEKICVKKFLPTFHHFFFLVFLEPFLERFRIWWSKISKSHPSELPISTSSFFCSMTKGNLGELELHKMDFHQLGAAVGSKMLWLEFFEKDAGKSKMMQKLKYLK